MASKRRIVLIVIGVVAATAALYAAASYPSSVKSFSTKLAGATISAAHVNDLQDEVVAIEGALLNGFAHVLKPSSAGGQDLGTSGVPWGNAFVTGLKYTDATTLTLATDTATVIHSYHALDTEGAAGTDDCATLTAGTGVAAGFVVVVRAANVAHVVTMKDGTGNLLLNGDYALNSTDATISLIYDGTNWRELSRSVTNIQTIEVLDKSTTSQTVSSSVALTSIYSFSIPANKLSTNRTLELTLTGYYSNTSGGNSTLAFTGVYGGTTFLTGSTFRNFQTATTGPIVLTIRLNANGTTNSQRAVSTVEHITDATTVAAGTLGATTVLSAFHDTLAEDSTAAKTFSVSVQHGTSAATIVFKRFAAILRVLG